MSLSYCHIVCRLTLETLCAHASLAVIGSARLQTDLESTKAKTCGRVALLWRLSAGLAPPNGPLRQVQQFLASCTAEGETVVSHTSVAAARDAFAQILRFLNREDVRRCCRHGLEARKPVIFQHLHDKASLRVRSYRLAGSKFARGRSSSVQSHAAKVFSGDAMAEL